MKHVGTIVLVSIIFSMGCFAQKTKQENLGRYSYTQLPLSPLPQAYQSFFVEVSTASGNKYVRDVIINAIKINGYSKIDDQADFRVFVDEYNFSYGKPELKKETITHKVDGIEKKETYYYYVTESNYKIRVSVFDNEDNRIYEKDHYLGRRITSKSHESSANAFKELKNTIANEQKKALENGMGSINADLDNQFGFLPKYFNVDFYYVKPKKFDYPDFDEALELARTGTSILTENEDATENAKESLTKAITLWEKALEESNLEKRKTRVNKNVTYAAHFNIGVAKLLLKEYETALDHFNACTDIKFGGGGISYMLEIAESRKKRALANNS